MKLEDQSRMSIDFNTNTGRKEDVSNRLRAHNIKRARDETKKLETESKKMEERLTELRMAMNREKEEREKSGGGFWSRGQTGNLNSYAVDVLNKPARSSKEGKKKVKVLKDSPINLPERPKQPGTMGFIARQDPSAGNTPKQKVKGPKCGQCEEKKAAVSCIQCSEMYCPSCFAAFHLKGALKKHRSVPISAAGPRVCMSPRPTTPQYNSNSIEFHSSQSEGAEDHYHTRIQSHRDRNSPEGASGSFDGGSSSLLTGDYSEAESAASFQQALMAWRTGGAEESPQVQTASPRKAYSPVKSPIVQVDSGTGTVEKKKPLEINFHSDLTYAERLLLKKHRRTDLQHMATPRLGELPPTFRQHIIKEEPRSISATPRNYPKIESPENDPWIQGQATPRVQPFPGWQEGVDEEDVEVERVAFHALYEAVKSTHPVSGQMNKDDMDIVELDSVDTSEVNLSSFKKKSKMAEYVIQQRLDQSMESAKECLMMFAAVKFCRSISSANVAKRNSKLEETSTCMVQEIDDMEAWTINNQNNHSKSYPNVFRKSAEQPPKSAHRSQKSARSIPPFAARAHESVYNQYSSKNNEISQGNSSQPQDATNLHLQSIEQSRPQSQAKPRPKSSVKSRPQSSARPKSQQSQQSRPGSRANRRAGSRIEGEGFLTKGPSQGLTQVAMMAKEDKQKSYSSAFNEFFMLGVTPEQSERTVTPTNHKVTQVDKVKISSRLYQMSPRSWRPDSSLADNVPSETVQADTVVDNILLPNEDELADLEIPDALSPDRGRNSVQSSRQQQSRAEIIQSLTGSLQFHQTTSPTYDNHDSFNPEDDDTFPDLPPTPTLRMTTPHPISVRSRPDSGTPRPSSSVPRPPSGRRQITRPTSQSCRSSSRFSQSDNDDVTPRASSITPHPGHRITPRPVSRTESFHNSGEQDGRDSRAIVMDGEDLSSYDTVGEVENRNIDDEEALDNLEWELASETGRITEEGKISRMSLVMDMDDAESTGSAESVRSFSRMSLQDQGYDINSRLRDDELIDEDDDEDLDEEEVKALQ